MPGNIATFDVIVFVILGLSLLMGFVRGITRETLGLCAWGGSGFASYFAFPHVKGLLSNYIQNQNLAEYATYGGMFIAFLVLFSILSHVLSSVIKRSMFGGVDRTLGFGFGALRALTLFAAFDIGMGVFFTRTSQPKFVAESRTIKHIHFLGDQALYLIPLKWRNIICEKRKKAADLIETQIKDGKTVIIEPDKEVEALSNLMPKQQQEMVQDGIKNSDIDDLLDTSDVKIKRGE